MIHSPFLNSISFSIVRPCRIQAKKAGNSNWIKYDDKVRTCFTIVPYLGRKICTTSAIKSVAAIATNKQIHRNGRISTS